MSLLEKAEALLDELLLLAKEERARRNLPWPYRGEVDLYGPRGTEIRWDYPSATGNGYVAPGKPGGT